MTTSKTQHPHLSDEQLNDIQQLMLRFAYNQVNDHGLAEDLVQETLIKTLTYQDKFHGKSAYQTWVLSILKNTITDHYRRKQTVNFSDTEYADEDNVVDRLFDKNGHWQEGCHPLPLPDPHQVCENEAFFTVLEHCLDALPAEQSRVFLMREYLDMDTPAICAESNITDTKYYVLMHRARLKLQSCLGSNWLHN